MHQTLPPSLSSAEREPSPTVRVTVPVRQDVLDTFQRLAKAGSMSTGRAMGEWLADTIEAASFMAEAGAGEGGASDRRSGNARLRAWPG